MKYLKPILLISSLALFLLLAGCSSNASNSEVKDEKVVVAVSIVPQETFIKNIAGDLVDIVTLIPPGYSPANYQPTPKEIAKFSDAEIYFSMGVPTEKANTLNKIDDLNKNMKVIDLASVVGEIYPHRYMDEHNHDDEDEEGQQHDGRDPHIWLSPKRAILIVETMKNELVIIDPENKNVYEKNALEYIDKLKTLDESIKSSLSKTNYKKFIIHHPSYGYFADDYGLEMIAIEEDGKDATAKGIKGVIDLAKEENIKFILYQEEFDNNQAEAIARDIGGITIKVAPLSANYIENLEMITAKFTEILD